MPPPGLLRLGGELLAAGFDVGLDDLAFRLGSGALGTQPHSDEGAQEFPLAAQASRWLLQRGPTQALGLSTMGATLPAALAIAEHFHAQRPEVPILIGGPGTTGTDVALLERFPWIHAVVRGEGEFTLAEWLLRKRTDSIADWEGIAGVTFRDAEGIVQRNPDRPARRDMHKVADYAWHLLPPLPEYKALTGEEAGLVPLDSGRGCAYDCSFCTIGRYWQRRSRPLPVPRLVKEVLSLQEMPGAGQAYLCHDIFGADRQHAMELCASLIEAGSPVPFEVRARLDHLDPELLEKMAQAGCYRVLLGIESASHDVRERHQKQLRQDVDPLTVIDACEAVGIVPILSMILGLPGEGENELAQTLDLCAAASLRKGVHVSLHLVNPQPGCALGEEVGDQSQEVEGIAPDMALGCGRSTEERALIEAHPDLFSSFHLLPAALFPDGIESLRELASMAKGLPELWRRYARTYALASRLLECDALVLWRTWKASGLSFAGWVRTQGDERLSACLAWEQTSLRVAACDAENQPQHSPSLPIPRGELFQAGLDLGALAEALRHAGKLPKIGPKAPYAVVPGPGIFGSVRTLKVSPDVVKLMSWLEGQRAATGPNEPGEPVSPRILQALEPLHKAGLLSSPAVPCPE